MEALIEVQVPGGTVAILRDAAGAITFAPPDPQVNDPRPLTEAIHLMWLDPVVVGGLLPAGVTAVTATDVAWAQVLVGDGVWLARAADGEPGERAAPSDLGFLDADSVLHPIPGTGPHRDAFPAPPPPALEPLPPLTAEGRAYAAALVDAIAADVAEHGPPAPLCRVVIRWFWEGDPLYLTLHVLAADDEQPPAEDTWYPLEWANSDRELERTDRVLGRPEVVAAGKTLLATFPLDESGMPEDGEAHLPSVEEAVDTLAGAFAARGIALTEAFAISSAHFEGWGTPADDEA